MQIEILLLDKIKIFRKEPKNLKAKDLWLFEHEFVKEFPIPFIAGRKNIFINSNIEFTKKYKADAIIAKQANFFLFTFFSLFRKALKFEVAIILKKSAIITDGWSFGYFHWLMDCLPRLMLLKNSGIDLPLLLPEGLSQYNYVKDSLLLLGENDFKFLKKDRWFLVRTLCFPSHLAPTGNYNDEMMQTLRQTFTHGIKKEPVLKVYISRRNALRRKISNETDILPVLLQAGFTEIICEDLSFAEQIGLFSKVKYLVTNHGAGLSNILFMAGGTSVLELRRENDNHNNCYFSLASALSINYYYLECMPVNASENPHAADIIVNVSELTNQLHNMCKKI